MTIKTSGTLSMQEINAEFGLGTNLYAYRGVKWYRDDNSRGYFDQAMGNNPPIDMLEFYGKRKTIPVVASGPTAQTNGSFFTVPFYNKITITIRGGAGGQSGAFGFYQGGFSNGQLTGSSNGGTGGSSSFGVYGSAAGGAGGSGNAVSGAAGSTTIVVFDAETNPNAPLKGIAILSTVGGAGGGGQGGPIYTSTDGKFNYTFAGYAASGSAGTTPGSITIKVE